LLEPYLAQHPERVAVLWRYVPEVKGGLRGHWRLGQGKLELVRLSVEGVEDALVEQAVWQTLFPEQRDPLVPWWLNGVWRFTNIEKVPKDPPGVFVAHIWLNLELELEAGKVTYCGGSRLGPDTERVEPSPFEWPLWKRMLAAPLMLVALPASLVWLPWRGYREGRPFPWTFVFEGPVFAMLILLAWIAPVRLQRRILRQVERIGERYKAHWSVRGLVKEALE
jgi:hypothetical protein